MSAPADLWQWRAEARPDRTVVTLAGELDVSSVDEVRSLLTDVIRATPVVDIEMAGLTFIDSTILGALIAAHHDATASGGSLTLLNPAGHVRRVLIVTGVLPLLGPERSWDRPGPRPGRPSAGPWRVPGAAGVPGGGHTRGTRHRETS